MSEFAHQVGFRQSLRCKCEDSLTACWLSKEAALSSIEVQFEHLIAQARAQMVVIALIWEWSKGCVYQSETFFFRHRSPFLEGISMNVSWPLFFLIIGGLLFLIVLTLFWPRKVGTRAVFRDDDRYWYGRDILYNNPDDPAVIVPKRYTGGYTVNFGHPVGKLIMIATLLLIVVLAILTGLGVIPSSGCH